MIDVDKAAWQPEAVYVQFFSQDGCSFSLTANYKEEEEMREKRQNQKGAGRQIKLMRGKFREMIEDRIAMATGNFKAEVRK